MGKKVVVPSGYAYSDWAKIVGNHKGHWFDLDTMRFFGSRISWGSLVRTNCGWLFVSSEHNFDRSARLYSVRFVSDDFDISTIGDFGGYASLSGAKYAVSVRAVTNV